jgi:glycosyltransferase involved in cell wall biosynthesis
MKTIIGIDASRCRSGGSYAHVKGIISNLDISKFGINEIHIWSHRKLLDMLPDEPWLIKHSPKLLNGSLIGQVYWQACKLTKELKNNGFDGLLTLDASSFCRFSPQVVLSQDMLSYEPGLMQKYPWSAERVRLQVILWLQNASFRRAVGAVFLSNYASRVIQQSCGQLPNVKIIPHGVGENFRNKHRNKLWPTGDNPIQCLYISNAALYKNQWHVVRAIELLRNEGFNINLTLVGGGSGYAQKKLNEQILKSDPTGKFVKQLDFVAQDSLPNHLAQADVFVFASGCEAFGITLLEAMATGIPIACSNKSSLPELLDGAGTLYDPENPSEIALAIRQLIEDPQLRERVAAKARQNSEKYSWQRCSNETFSFVINNSNN